VNALHSPDIKKITVGVIRPLLTVSNATRAVAEMCGVSHQFVASVRGQVQTVSSSPQRAETRVGRDGKQYPAQRNAAPREGSTQRNGRKATQGKDLSQTQACLALWDDVDETQANPCRIRFYGSFLEEWGVLGCGGSKGRVEEPQNLKRSLRVPCPMF